MAFASVRGFLAFSLAWSSWVVCPDVNAAAITTVSSAYLNSSVSVQDQIPDSVIDYRGATTQVSSTGAGYFGVYNGTRYTDKFLTETAYAQANLSAGQLKARASVAIGTDLAGTGSVPIGSQGLGSSAEAYFGDSFRAFNTNGNAAFNWTSSTAATFNFNVSGTPSKSAGLVNTGGQDQTNIYAGLQLSIFRPGYLDIYEQLRRFDINAYPSFDEAFAALDALSARLTANTILNQYWILGTYDSPYPLVDAMLVPLDSNGAARIGATFNPGSDFDWVLSLSAFSAIDGSLQNVFSDVDFSHTISAAYVAPAGSVTGSASGLFPGTIALETNLAVPEPDSFVLLTLGALAGIGGARSRRRSHGHGRAPSTGSFAMQS